MSVRPQDSMPFERNARSAIMRIGTISTVSTDGTKANISTTGGGMLIDVTVAESITDPTTRVGRRVVVLLDQENALAIALVP